MSLLRCALACLALLALAPLASLAAQQPEAPAGMDIIRGRVVGPDSQPVFGAYVVVRLARGKETREAVTNEHGAYTVLFPGAAGDYVVTARFIGLAPATVRVGRTGQSRVLTGDMILAPARGAQHELAPVAVTARTRPRPARSGGTPSIDDREAAGAEVLGQLGDDFGAPFDPRRYSVLGADPSENTLVVNGAEVQTVLPDAVGVGGKVTTTSADASVGGFSGGQLAVGIGGAMSYHLRMLRGSFAPAALQWVDRPSAQAGARNSTLGASLWTSDPLFDQRAHTTSTFTYSQQTTPLPEFPTSPTGLARLGLAADSLARFLALMGQAGIPATVDALPSQQRSSRLAWMGRLELGRPDATTQVSLDANLGTSGTEGAFLSPSALASHGGSTRRTGGFVTASLSRYVGNNYLTDFSTTVNAFTSRTAPYLALPEGRVRVLSALPTGDSALTWLSFGGHPAAAGRSRTTTWQSRGSTTWHSVDTTRRYRVGGEVLAERLWADQASNTRGAFEFASLEALAAGQAERFTRQTQAAAQRGSGVRGALFTDNRWAVHPRFDVQYGLRLDLARVAAPVGFNPVVDSLFGARTDALPGLAEVSPRIGLRWRYGARNVPSALALSAGRYQSQLGAGTAIAASQATGLASAARLLDCVGDAVPAADWASYGADVATIPATCADGSGGVPAALSVPSVRQFDGYQPPAEWRARLTWDNYRWTWLRMSLTHSRGTAQSSVVDLNLQPAPAFTLAAEGDRPVYVPAAAIVPATGAASLADSRRSTRFGPVLAARSDLSSSFTELAAHKVLLRGQPVALVIDYRYQLGREKARGFDRPTAGDPFAAVWGRTPAARHGVDVFTSLNFSTQVRLTALLMLQSGMPYTPRVAGDVNGDGASNDIAFIPSPSSALGEEVAAVLRGAPAAARSCLGRQAGRVAARNSCTGPWSGRLDLRLELSPSWLPREAGLQLHLSNAAGAVDRLLHGTAGARGWGDSPGVDPMLLVVQGFDPATRQYRYQVNPRFGQQAGAGRSHRPVELRLSFQSPIGPSLTAQQNGTRARRARASQGDPSAVGRVMSVDNVFHSVLRLEKSLQLGPDQTDSLRAMEGRWRQAIDSTQTALADYLGGLSDAVPDREILARVAEAAARSAASTKRWLPAIRALLTEDQLERLPGYLHAQLTGRPDQGPASFEPF